MVALLVSEALYCPSPWPSPRGEDEGGRTSWPEESRCSGAFWGVDNSERVAIKGRIA